MGRTARQSAAALLAASKMRCMKRSAKLSNTSISGQRQTDRHAVCAMAPIELYSAELTDHANRIVSSSLKADIYVVWFGYIQIRLRSTFGSMDSLHLVLSVISTFCRFPFGLRKYTTITEPPRTDAFNKSLTIEQLSSPFARSHLCVFLAAAGLQSDWTSHGYIN